MATGGAIMVPSAMALVRNGLPRARRARAFGTFGAVMGLSAALGPLIGGELTARFAWPAVFVVNAVPLGLSVLLGAGAPTPPPLAKRPTLDLAGTGLLSLSLLLFIVGLKARGAEAFLALSLASATGIGFVRWERRALEPVLDPALFGLRTSSAGAAIIGLQNLAMYALLFELPLFFTDAFGTDARRGPEPAADVHGRGAQRVRARLERRGAGRQPERAHEWQTYLTNVGVPREGQHRLPGCVRAACSPNRARRPDERRRWG